MLKKIMLGTISIVVLSLVFMGQGFTQEDKVLKIAIETAKTQMRIPREMEVKFVEKKESLIPGFYALKLTVISPDKEIPIIVYVDQTGEKVIIGNLFLKGENITRKEAGEPIARKINMGQLDLDKSPFRGSEKGKATIVEFSNFQCPYCVKSWNKMKDYLEKYPQEIKYIFKHFPLQPLGKSFELSEMAAAAQEVSYEAFWMIHDFFFSDEGQALAKEERGKVLQKIEQMLKEKGHDVKAFQTALETGKAKKRVEGDVALGGKVPVMGTPTIIINGDFIKGSITDKVLEQYLAK
jgi:protein-disulfide isomerase